MKLSNKIKITIASALIALASFVIGGNSKPLNLGGSSSGDAFNFATTTGTQASFPNYRNAFRSNFAPGYGTTTPGVLGVIKITAKGTSAFNVYDATSTASNAENTEGTTTLASFGPNAAEGDYYFNYPVKRGVLIEYTSAATVGWASTTVTGNR